MFSIEHFMITEDLPLSEFSTEFPTKLVIMGHNSNNIMNFLTTSKFSSTVEEGYTKYFKQAQFQQQEETVVPEVNLPPLNVYECHVRKVSIFSQNVKIGGCSYYMLHIYNIILTISLDIITNHFT